MCIARVVDKIKLIYLELYSFFKMAVKTPELGDYYRIDELSMK